MRILILYVNYFQLGCVIQIKILHLLHSLSYKYYLNNTNRNIEHLFYQFLISSIQCLLLLNPLHVLEKEMTNIVGEAGNV